MSDRILGPSGSKRRGFWRRRFFFLPVIAIGAAALVFSSALAVHDTGRFQLDGDASTSTQPGSPPVPAATDDWDKVCHQVTVTDDTSNSIPDQCTTPNPGDTTGATAVSWTSEQFPTDGSLNSSIFTGGGSKDPQDISNWAWKDAGGLPQKDNLLHSFAARYTVSGQEYLFFGSDRFNNDGDAQQGFWFFQNEITLGDTPKGGGTTFNGVHKNGDLLVISDFSNGGDVSTITVYKWDSTCLKGVNNPIEGDLGPNGCGDANLRLLSTDANARCGSAVPDNACGLVNEGTTPIDSPWTFNDSAGSSDFRQGEFFEGGVNLTALGLAGQCFASAASESRSSTSTTATLKDFVLGEFAQCAVSTEQEWLPQDTAQVTGGVPGTVTFKLYENANCDPADLVATFTDSDGSDGYRTNNTTHSYTDDTTISWSATFTPTDQNPIDAEFCEMSDLTIDNEDSEFTPPSGVQRTLNVNVTGTGTVTDTGISCPNDCVQTYPNGTSVTLHADPATGSSFGSWGGDVPAACTSTGSCTLTMDADKAVTANFTSP